MEEKKRKESGYRLKIIERDGATCVGIHGKSVYSVHGDREPRGSISKEYKDKKQKRGVILTKLGIWENGQNLELQKKQI